MDFRVHRKTAELGGSTQYVEVGPGRYSGEHWQDGFLFVREDAFGVAEGIVTKHFPGYSHFGTNDVSVDVGRAVIAEWRDVAGRLATMNIEQVCDALHLDAAYRDYDIAEIDSHRSEIARMLIDLADRCEAFYEQEEWVCVLGV